MCNEPVMFGGGIVMVYGVAPGSGLGEKSFALSHLPYHFCSTAEGSYAPEAAAGFEVRESAIKVKDS
jgi:hypothetical protein